jgi:hypothetical protein
MTFCTVAISPPFSSTLMLLDNEDEIKNEIIRSSPTVPNADELVVPIRAREAMTKHAENFTTSSLRMSRYFP